jgi:two-component system, LuxR family, response regulator FixJ
VRDRCLFDREAEQEKCPLQNYLKMTQNRTSIVVRERGPAKISDSELGTVIVVEDDELMRVEVEALLSSVGYPVRTYACANEMLNHESDPCGVFVIDLRLKGMSGLILQKKLSNFPHIQIIFISGYADVEDAVVAMKAGAFEFLVKPFRPQALIDAIGCAFAKLARSRAASEQNSNIWQCYNSLTDTEKEVAALVAMGLRSKEIAYRVQKAENTVKVHRGRVMQKMVANSVPDLSRKLRDIGIDCDPS